MPNRVSPLLATFLSGCYRNPDINYIEIAPQMVRIVSSFPLEITLTVGEDVSISILEHPSRHSHDGERRAQREEAGEGPRRPWWRLWSGD